MATELDTNAIAVKRLADVVPTDALELLKLEAVAVNAVVVDAFTNNVETNFMLFVNVELAVATPCILLDNVPCIVVTSAVVEAPLLSEADNVIADDKIAELLATATVVDVIGIAVVIVAEDVPPANIPQLSVLPTVRVGAELAKANRLAVTGIAVCRLELQDATELSAADNMAPVVILEAVVAVAALVLDSVIELVKLCVAVATVSNDALNDIAFVRLLILVAVADAEDCNVMLVVIELDTLATLCGDAESLIEVDNAEAFDAIAKHDATKVAGTDSVGVLVATACADACKEMFVVNTCVALAMAIKLLCRVICVVRFAVVFAEAINEA